MGRRRAARAGPRSSSRSARTASALPCSGSAGETAPSSRRRGDAGRRADGPRRGRRPPRPGSTPRPLQATVAAIERYPRPGRHPVLDRPPPPRPPSGLIQQGLALRFQRRRGTEPHRERRGAPRLGGELADGPAWSASPRRRWTCGEFLGQRNLTMNSWAGGQPVLPTQLVAVERLTGRIELRLGERPARCSRPCRACRRCRRRSSTRSRSMPTTTSRAGCWCCRPPGCGRHPEFETPTPDWAAQPGRLPRLVAGRAHRERGAAAGRGARRGAPGRRGRAKRAAVLKAFEAALLAVASGRAPRPAR